MDHRKAFFSAALLLGLLAACTQTPAAPLTPTAPGATTQVTLQLKWLPQAQFAGYYAAVEQGFYAAEGLQVSIRPGGPDIVPEEVVARGKAEFGVGWLAALLKARDEGRPLVNIAQLYQYSGMREISWQESGLESPADYRDKRIAVWFGGNQYSLLATLDKYGLDPQTDLTLIAQPFDMSLLLEREVHAAAAMSYNELYQVLKAGHTLVELDIVDFNDEDTAMLEDGLFVNEEWLRDPAHRDIATRFLRASLRGWEYCRDQVADCVEIVLAHDDSGRLSRDAQEWQLSEVNKLIWGDPIDPQAPLGRMDPERFKRTAEIAYRFDIISQPAGEQAYTHEIWQQATQD